MIKFTINGVELNPNIGPTIVPTEDGTLDTGTLVLPNTRIKEPISPMQKVNVDFDDGERLVFFTTADHVEITKSFGIKRYTHNIAITQNTRKTAKYLVRNTVFSQPPLIEKKAYTAVNFALDKLAIKMVAKEKDAQWVENIKLEQKEKISRAYLKSRCFIVVNNKETGKKEFLDRKDPSVYFVDGLGDSIYGYIKSVKTGEVFLFQPYGDGLAYNEQALKRFIENNGDGEYTINLEPTQTKKWKYKFDQAVEPTSLEDLDIDTPLLITWQVELCVQTYYYSVYDVLDILEKQYEQEMADYTVREKLYKLPKSGELYNLLTKTISPNFTFTQATYFEALSEVFKVFDALFTIGSDNVLGIEYLNKADREQANIDFVGKTKNISEDKYSNGLVSYYQNAIQKECYPSQNGVSTIYAPLRSETLGVPTKESFVFQTPHTIDNVLRVLIQVKGLTGALAGGISYDVPDMDVGIDITRFIVESSLWSLLNPTDEYYRVPQELTQAATIPYTKGTNFISISSYFRDSLGLEGVNLWNALKLAIDRFFGTLYIPPSGPYVRATYDFNYPVSQRWEQVKLAVNYLANIDGRLKVEGYVNKYKGEILSNQASGMVDIHKLGLNMLGLSHKIGEPTLVANQDAKQWKDVIKKGQVYIDENNDKWVANVCQYTFYNTFVRTNVQFVKNFNGLAQRTQVNKKKRLTNISREMAVKAEDNLVQYLYVSTIPFNEFGTQIALTKSLKYDQGIESLEIFAKQIAATFGKECDEFIGYARLNTFGWNNAEFIASTYLPLVKYGSGNALCFEMAMNDPINAGNNTKVVAKGWFGENKYFTTVVPYADANGFFESCIIAFESTKGANPFDDDFPNVLNVESNFIGFIDNLKYYKKPNEIFALNYELMCLPYKGREDTDIIASKFIDENGIIKGVNKKQLYIYFATSQEYFSISSTKAGQWRMAKITNVEINLTHDYKFSLTITHESAHISYNARWAIVDEDRNIYFATNQAVEPSLTKTLYFITKKYRL